MLEEKKKILVFLMLITVLEGFTIVDHYPDDDLVVEHAVSYDEAIAQARNLSIPSGPIPGCKACTSDEMTYCKDGSVINDHCCCDGGYNKVFPFVEHTCHVGRSACTIKAGDCAEYTRIRECCCHAHLASIWKYRAGGVTRGFPNLLTIAGVLPAFHLCHKLLWNLYYY